MTDREIALSLIAKMPPDSRLEEIAETLRDFAGPAASPTPSESESPPSVSEPGDFWTFLDSVTGAVDGPTDWSVEHDHYLYGTPKRHDS